jgi:hypothetical protein
VISFLAIACFLAPAQAGSQTLPSDVIMSSVGAQAIYSVAMNEAAGRVLLAERIRWQLAEGGVLEPRLMVDGRLAIDPLGESPLSQAYVRQLGLIDHTDERSLYLGRHPVYQGGPRLVDGVQILSAATPSLTIGGWGGMAPDMFTTRPTSRVGGGPVVEWQHSRGTLSSVGEALWYRGALDRASLLTLGHIAAGPKAGLDARLDVQLTDEALPNTVADAALFAHIRPTDAWRLGAMYDAYSSYRYLASEDYDPTINRFEQRSQTLGLPQEIPDDMLDPTLHQLVGLSGRWAPELSPGELGPMLSLDLRTRPLEDSHRVSPAAELHGLWEQRIVLRLDANLMTVDQQDLGDLGLVVSVEPDSDRRLLLDSSARLLVDNTAYGGDTGWYVDLFADWVSPAGLVLSGGIFATEEPYFGFRDSALGSIVRISWWHRPGRPAPWQRQQSGATYEEGMK